VDITEGAYGAEVPQRRRASPPPKDFLISGAFPTGRLRSGAPVEARYAQLIARNLQDALEGRNRSELAESADIARRGIYKILNGEGYPDSALLAQLEQALGVTLWPTPPP
jgi:DNA-binding phage protein